MNRYLVFVKCELSLDKLKNLLRSEGLNVIDIRKGKLIEIDLIASNDTPFLDYIGKYSNVISYVSVGKNSETVWELFNDMRFWEVHEKVESIWRTEKDEERKKIEQALILLAASMIKYTKGNEIIADKLISSTLSLVSELPEDSLSLLNVLSTLYPERCISIDNS
ncbi:hypothetical protein HS7_09620 [Sulfolobales archaeon HS-7]|nr:hypothetical protein HS7_09620 [Sulfolobales archaeon HS-7]